MKKVKVTWTWIDWLSNNEIKIFINDHFNKELLDILSLPPFVTKNVVMHLWNFQCAKEKEYSISDFQQLLNKSRNKQKLLDTVAAGIHYWDKIVIFNQDFVSEVFAVLSWKTIQEAELEYFEWINILEVPKLYKIGIVPHEIWHSLYALKIKRKVLEKNRKTITDNNFPVTAYVKMYKLWSSIYYEENFTEALRIYLTNTIYLQKNYPEIHNFISINFPEIIV